MYICGLNRFSNVKSNLEPFCQLLSVQYTKCLLFLHSNSDLPVRISCYYVITFKTVDAKRRIVTDINCQ